jgi:hypothetical protein
LVFGAVIPARVEICKTRHCLLVHTAAVGVDLSDTRVIDGGVVYYVKEC